MAIQNGTMNGYLAFEGEQCIGWLNANNAESYTRPEEYMRPYIADQKIGLTICFVIHPKYRNRGVATALLREAIDVFKEEGFDAVLALPIAANTFSEKLYRGTVSMYEKAGYKTIETVDEMHIMKLKL